MMPSDPFIAKVGECMELFMRLTMRNFFQFARKKNLSMPQIGALFVMEKGGASGISNLSDHLGVTSAAGSQMLDRLVQQELILRMEDPNDRRVKKIELTEKGRQLLEESVQVRKRWLSDLAGTLSGGEKEQIASAMNILKKKLGRLEESS
jgi:DNA-binding MarR family transcriptional regulator